MLMWKRLDKLNFQKTQLTQKCVLLSDAAGPSPSEGQCSVLLRKTGTLVDFEWVQLPARVMWIVAGLLNACLLLEQFQKSCPRASWSCFQLVSHASLHFTSAILVWLVLRPGLLWREET